MSGDHTTDPTRDDKRHASGVSAHAGVRVALMRRAGTSAGTGVKGRRSQQNAQAPWLEADKMRCGTIRPQKQPKGLPAPTQIPYVL